MLALAGCAGPSYVVLLPDNDGIVGKVVVSAAGGTTVLDKDRQATQIGGPAGVTFTVDEARLQKDFGAALAAAPTKPAVFRLYFENAGENLTAASRASIALILQAIAARPAADLSITGHADTVGRDDPNIELGWRRARFVADVIERAGVGAVRVRVESHGEKNLLVPTPDETAEPMNRRVEVTVR